MQHASKLGPQSKQSDVRLQVLVWVIAANPTFYFSFREMRLCGTHWRKQAASIQKQRGRKKPEKQISSNTNSRIIHADENGPKLFPQWQA